MTAPARVVLVVVVGVVAVAPVVIVMVVATPGAVTAATAIIVIAVVAGHQAGDEVIAMWELDEGTHYIIRGISKFDPAGQALALVLMQAQLRETYQQINQLQTQINDLQNMLRKALEPKPAQ